MFGQAKPLASLSSGLLARKGAARPAMRPQGFASLGPTQQQLDDLGWNDMGPETEALSAPLPSAPLLSMPVEKPPVLVAREALVEAVAAPLDVPLPAAVHPVSVATATRLAKETAHAGRAAFTLRLDAERHLKLRLASALASRSAQQVVTEALDCFLETIPEVAALRAQLPPQTPSRAKGKRR